MGLWTNGINFGRFLCQKLGRMTSLHTRHAIANFITRDKYFHVHVAMRSTTWMRHAVVAIGTVSRILGTKCPRSSWRTGLPEVSSSD